MQRNRLRARIFTSANKLNPRTNFTRKRFYRSNLSQNTRDVESDLQLRACVEQRDVSVLPQQREVGVLLLYNRTAYSTAVLQSFILSDYFIRQPIQSPFVRRLLNEQREEEFAYEEVAWNFVC